jgi:8-oxo-dGTP pyrophosphatase MutT (NUDIX family)
MSPWLERLAGALARTDSPVPADDGIQRAAVAAVLRDDPAGPSVLLMKRTEQAGDPWSGHISLPGGRYEAGDPDLLATAIREAREELAIDLAPLRVLGNLPAMHPRSSGPRGIAVTPFVFALPGNAVIEPRAGPEAQAAFWLPLPLAASGKLDGTYLHPSAATSWPAWIHEGYTIWGLTMRILGDLIQRAA